MRLASDSRGIAGPISLSLFHDVPPPRLLGTLCSETSRPCQRNYNSRQTKAHATLPELCRDAGKL
jgi:hypothetical protein